MTKEERNKHKDSYGEKRESKYTINLQRYACLPKLSPVNRISIFVNFGFDLIFLLSKFNRFKLLIILLGKFRNKEKEEKRDTSTQMQNETCREPEAT